MFKLEGHIGYLPCSISAEYSCSRSPRPSFPIAAQDSSKRVDEVPLELVLVEMPDSEARRGRIESEE